MSISATRIPVPPFHLEPAYHDKTDVPGKESMSSISGLRANKLPDFANSTLLESARVVHCGKHSEGVLKGKVVCPRCMPIFGFRSPAFENAAFKHTETQCLHRQQSAFGLRSDQLRYSWIDANGRYSVGPNTIGNVSAHISTQENAGQDGCRMGAGWVPHCPAFVLACASTVLTVARKLPTEEKYRQKSTNSSL